MKTERRTFNTNLRASTIGKTKRLSGYAARFNSLSEDLGGFKEVIKFGAFSKSIKSDDIRALFNHDSNFVLGRTSARTLKLREDSKGLWMDVILPDTQTARDLWVSIQRGDITQQSFSFNVVREDWDESDKNNVVRTLQEVKLHEVSPTPWPAYPQTDVAARAKSKSKGAIIMIPELQQEKAKLVVEMRTINDQYSQGQAYSADHEESYQKMEVRLNQIGQEIRKERLEHEAAALDAGGVTGSGMGYLDYDPMASANELRDRSRGALKNINDAEIRGIFSPGADGVTRMGLSDLNIRADEQALQDDRDHIRLGQLGITEEQRQRLQSRALQGDVDISGGYMLGEQIASQVIRSLMNSVFIRRYSTVITLGIGVDTLGCPTLDADPEDATWSGEITPANEDTEMSFEKRSLTPIRLCKLLKASKSLVQRSPMAEQIIRARMNYKLSIPQERAFLLGSLAAGNEPLGVFVASDAGIPTSRDVSSGNTATAIKADGLINCAYSLKAQYRRRARWIFHRDAIKTIRKLKDGQGQYLWRLGIASDRPDTILDLPFDESEYAPSTFTTGKYVGILGDFSFYWICDSLNMRLQVLLELYARTNQNGYLATTHTDSMPVLGEAFARVKLS